MLGVCKDPVLVILGFEHEYTEPGYQDVINLRGAVFKLERDVTEKVIVRAKEVGL